MKSVAEDLWSELKNNGIIYLYIFFFFTGIIFIIYYKFKSFNTSSLADIFYLYSVLTLITLLLKYVACLFHPLDRWSKIRPRKWPAIDVIIPGFNEGVEMMSYGDKIMLYIPSELGYGQQGAGDVIPPNANIVFEVELLENKPIN